MSAAFPYGAAIEAGAGLLGGFLSSRSEKKAQKRALRYNDQQQAAAFQYLKESRGRDALFGGLERSALLSAHKKQMAGYGGARKALDLGALAARQTIQGRGKQAQADVEQSVVSRGLLGTSTGVQQFAGVGDRTTMQLAAIDQGLAQQLAELGLDEAETAGGQGRELAQLAMRDRDLSREYDYAMAELAPRGYGLPPKQPATMNLARKGTNKGSRADSLAAILARYGQG